MSDKIVHTSISNTRREKVVTWREVIETTPVIEINASPNELMECLDGAFIEIIKAGYNGFEIRWNYSKRIREGSLRIQCLYIDRLTRGYYMRINKVYFNTFIFKLLGDFISYMMKYVDPETPRVAHPKLHYHDSMELGGKDKDTTIMNYFIEMDNIDFLYPRDIDERR